VGLSTISQHLDESGQAAVELLLSRISDPRRPVQHIQLPLTIVERETA
jgi:LacI family transcriptional regulator